MPEQEVKTALGNGVATLEIDRPQKKNAITGEMYLALAQALRDADSSAAVLMLGEPFGAAEAVALGIARRMAERFNALAPAAVRETKNLLKQPRMDGVQRAIAAEVAVFNDRLGSPEAREALNAFFQKRKPDFSRFS